MALNVFIFLNNFHLKKSIILKFKKKEKKINYKITIIKISCQYQSMRITKVINIVLFKLITSAMPINIFYIPVTTY